MTFEDELEKWIVTYLVTHPNHSIDVGVIIDEAPRSLVNQIKSSTDLYYFMMNIEATKGIIRRKFVSDFLLTTDGKLYFRKFIEPIFAISKDKERYTTIIEKTEGTPETRKSFKKLLESIKDELPDDAERILIKYLTETSVEAIFYLIKLVLSAHSAN